MKRIAAALLFATLACHGADQEAMRLREIAKGLARGEQEALASLQDMQGEAAARFVLDVISSSRLGPGIKARTAEIVAAWPATAPGRTTLLEWLAKHPRCEDDMLLFFAQIRLPGARGHFWSVIEEAKDGRLRQPMRVAVAVMALGFFEDNPETVVTRVGAFLAPEFPHVMRACAADALGGMKHARAVEALIPHVEDSAIGGRVVRSLYRLTGQHFTDMPETQWRDWLTAAGGKIDFKMHAAVDFENFLKVQALVQPDDAPMNMNTFYGLDVRGKGLLFILDVSGSMTADDRIQKLRAQMQNILVILQSRSPKTRYGILTFGDGIESCFPRGILENSDENRRRAERFIEKLQAGGGTPMVGVLEHALNKVLPDGNLDTVYFLSDGQPGDGTPQMVLDLTRKIFQRHQVRFNTISIGETLSAEFGKPTLLQEMSQITSGAFAQPK